MLKRMRWRLILAAMLAFFAVIALIAVLVNVVNHYVTTSRIDDTIASITNYEAWPPAGPNTVPGTGGGAGPAGQPGMGQPGAESAADGGAGPNAEPGAGQAADGGAGPAPESPPSAPFMISPDVESNYMMRFFIVRFDADGNVTSSSTDFIASIDEDEAVRYARKALAGNTDHGYMQAYRYAKRISSDGTVIVFLNVSRELQYMKSLRYLTLAVSGVSLALVFVLVVLFSGRAIRPIAGNIERQKQFITDASHELKTPLTSISTSVDVIALEHGEDEWTENIKKQTARMSKLVSELVLLSRLDEETPLPNKEHFSLSNAAWEITEVYQPQAKARGKLLTAEIQDDVMLFGEKPAIQQMLSVLLDNAVRYSDPESEIRFSVIRKRNKVQIEVFNTCEYDTPPDARRLFDRFYRPDNSRSTDTGGTGVGLAIAKAVAETHGGSITASCPSGKSMTIRVRL